MTQQKMYRYLGRNGILTTPILLEKIDPIPMVFLRASEGKILTNGVKKIYQVTVFEDEVSNWVEIEDGQN